jgi:hypothetical protein
MHTCLVLLKWLDKLNQTEPATLSFFAALDSDVIKLLSPPSLLPETRQYFSINQLLK